MEFILKVREVAVTTPPFVAIVPPETVFDEVTASEVVIVIAAVATYEAPVVTVVSPENVTTFLT